MVRREIFVARKHVDYYLKYVITNKIYIILKKYMQIKKKMNESH